MLGSPCLRVKPEISAWVLVPGMIVAPTRPGWGTRHRYNPIRLAMTSFMISSVPPPIRRIRLSR